MKYFWVRRYHNTSGNLTGPVTYDKNGNIQTLQRKGVGGTIDNLDYDYLNGETSNRLAKVADASNNTEGFANGSNTGDDYTYDANGNMTTDSNKEIQSIAYNHLNLPTVITQSNLGVNNTIDYIYAADGTKLKKTARDYSSGSGGTPVVTDYAGNYVYENGSLQFFSHPEGYVTPDGTGGYTYVYQYKDHLGNIRLSYTDDPSNPGTPTIIEENNYYPFGGLHQGYNMGGDNALGSDLAQKWKFGGKELDESLGLGTYDFGARNYDPWIGRWMNLDPLAEKYHPLSPYNYTANNPILYLDPDGKEIIIGGNTKDALTKLAQIAATTKGQKRLDRLINSRYKYRMNKVFWASNAAYDGRGTIGTARTIYYPSSVWWPHTNGDNKSLYYTGHEINHAYNHDYNGTNYDRKTEERTSVRFANYLRSVYGDGDDLRTSYSGLGLKFSDNENSYNRKGEGITDFTETLSVEAGGNTFAGFSYEKTEGGETSTEYIISVKTEDGTFAYRKFTDQKEYNAAVKRINEYQKKQKEEDENN